jgi:hypothetical protein
MTKENDMTKTVTAPKTKEKTAHTPGPWEAEVRGKLWDVYPTPRYPCQQPVASGHAGDISERHQAMAVANARLIAAAPCMLEALRNLVMDWERVIGPIPEDHEAQVAIAKAEGGAA